MTSCVHHWRLTDPRPGDGLVFGDCTNCGDTREFKGRYDHTIAAVVNTSAMTQEQRTAYYNNLTAQAEIRMYAEREVYDYTRSR